jgi:glycerol uptake facilitator-like aquaporin
MQNLIVSLLVEYIGTFIFLSVILETGKAIPISIALAAMILWGGSISGGHFNPAVSFMMFLKGNKDITTTLLYMVAQLSGALSAWVFVTKMIHLTKSK